MDETRLKDSGGFWLESLIDVALNDVISDATARLWWLQAAQAMDVVRN